MILGRTQRFYLRLRLALSYRVLADRQAGFRSTEPRLPTHSWGARVAVTQITVQRDSDAAVGTDAVALVPLRGGAAALLRLGIAALLRMRKRWTTWRVRYLHT